MEIILSILQILGIIFLVIIGIILLLICIVLFVPIRYQILGHVHNKIYFKGKIFWLLHLFRAKATYEDDLLSVEVSILWKKISFTKEFGASKESLEEEEETNTSKKINNGVSLDDSKILSNKETFEDGVSNEDDAGKINKIKEKIKFFKQKYTQIKKIIQDEKNKQAIKHLKDEFIYLIKILLPKKSQLKGIFSTGSPDTTGQIFGIICCFPIIYQDKWSLTPDFESEKAYFEGDFRGKGRIYLFQLLGILIRIVIDKNCRRLYYFINRLGGRNNGRGK